MGKGTNNLAAKHCVIWYERHEETPLDVLEEFVDWTKEKNIKSYIEISKMLYVTRNEAKRMLDLAVLPDDRIVKRMKEVMHESKRV